MVSGIITAIRELDFDPRQVNDQVDGVLAMCVDQCSQVVLDVQGQYNDQMYNIINDFSAAIGKNLPVQVQTPIAGISQSNVGSLNMQFSGFEEAVNTMYKGMAGAGLATIAVNLVGMLFPPLLVAGNIAAIIGSFAGGLKGSADLKAKRKEEAIGRMQSVLSDTVRKAQSQALRQFDHIAGEYEKSVRTALRQATNEIERELSEKVQSIADQRQRTREDAKARADELKRALEKSGSVLRMLARLAEPLPEKA
jgi:hypothetical protein